MCKLNLLCQKSDGECNCGQSNSKIVPGIKPQNGLLCSILSFIKSRPEIMKSLTETSNEVKTEDSIQGSSPASLEILDHSPTHNSIQEEVAEYSVNIISDLPSKFITGRGFPLLVEVLNKSSHRLASEEKLTYQALLLNQTDGKELEVLGEVTTNGAALFRKLIIKSDLKSASLLIRVSGRPDISHFSHDIKIRSKKTCSEPNRRHHSSS